MPPASGGRRFASDVVTLSGGMGVAQAVTIVAAPLVTRLFTPADMGVLTVFGSLVGLIAVVACLRFEVAIPLPNSDTTAASLFWVSLLAALPVSAACALLVVLGGDWIAAALNAPGLSGYLLLAPIAVLSYGVVSALSFWSTRTRQFRGVSVARVASSTTTTISQLAGGFSAQPGGGTLIVASVVGPVVSAAVLGREVWRRNGEALRSGFTVQQMLQCVTRYRKFPLLSTWGALANTLSLLLPPMLLSSIFAPSVVGYFALAQRILVLPVNLVSIAVAQVFFEQAARAKTEGSLSEWANAVFIRLLLMSAGPFLMLAVVGQDVFGVVFGDRWTEAGLYAQMLSPWIMCMFVAAPVAVLFSVTERQGLGLVVDVILLVSNIVALAIGGFVGRPVTAIALLSLTGVATMVFLALQSMALAGVPARKTIRELAFTIIRATPYCVPLLVAVLIGLPKGLVLGLTLICFTVYLLMSFRRDRLFLDAVSGLVRSRRSQ